MPKEQEKQLISWLESGEKNLCRIEHNRHHQVYLRQSAGNGLDIIYAYTYVKSEEIPIHDNVEYQGIYHPGKRKLYDAQYGIRAILKESLDDGCRYENMSSEFESGQ